MIFPFSLMATKTRNGGQWTEARFRSFVVSALRAASRRWPVKYAVLKDACVGRKVNSATRKMALHYRCAKCEDSFPATSIAVDHIKPVVDPKKGFVNWDTFIERLFCEDKGLQCLCKECHSTKTQAERKERRDAARD